VFSLILASDYHAGGDRLCAKIRLKMAQIKSWTMSDALWSKIERLVPARKRPRGRKYQRKPGAGRKPMPARQVFSAIVYVLRTGCQWKALPKEYGSASAVHAHFQRWQREGFFLKIWKAGLAEYDDMEGIAWRWQSVDGATGKAPLARECVGPNSTDRGKKWAQAQSSGGRPWHPAVARRQRSQPA
jgi:transposase